jgi:hypothetical protein
MSTTNLGAFSVEYRIQESEIEEPANVEDSIELALGTERPIIVGKRSLMEMATLSITIAEDMSS